MKKHKPRILILSLGGTWNAVANDAGVLQATPLLGKFNPLDLFVAEQTDIKPLQHPTYNLPPFAQQLQECCEVDGYGLFGIDSTNIGPDHWKLVADFIISNGEEYDGFVVMTGTDTLAPLSAALSFALRRFGKPVVVSGAQKSRHSPGNDAIFNLMNSCKVATLPAIKEVVVVFGSRIIRATRSKKFSERDLEAFESLNFKTIGRIRLDIEIDPTALLKTPEFGTKYWPDTCTNFDAEVGLLYLYPGMNPDILEATGKTSKAVILAAFGAGNYPGSEPNFSSQNRSHMELQEAALRCIRPLSETINNLRNQDIAVVIATQCVVGFAEVKTNTYSSGADPKVSIIVNDMQPEVAYVKARWLFSNFGDLSWHAFKKLMIRPVAGEITALRTRNDRKESSRKRKLIA